MKERNRRGEGAVKEGRKVFSQSAKWDFNAKAVLFLTKSAGKCIRSGIVFLERGGDW